MMKISCEYFGSLTLLNELPSHLELNDGASVADALQLLSAISEGTQKQIPACAVAMGEYIVANDTTLTDGGHIVLLPPVSGG